LRILVLEHLSLSPLEPGQGSLADEGFAMLAAVARDLASEPDVSVTAAVHSRLATSTPDAVSTLIVDKMTEAEIAAHAARFDRSLLVAPEIDGIAAAWSQRLESASASLLSPPSSVIRWASDKLAVAQTLRLMSPQTQLLDEESAPTEWGDELLVKPRFGAGSLFTARCNRNSILQLVQFIRGQGFEGDLLTQPMIDDHAVSAAVVARVDRPPVFLPPAEQRIIRVAEPSLPGVHWLKYAGGRLPIFDYQSRTAPLLQAVVDSLPRFNGWIGVDMILGPSADVIVDVNPRLTTSYLGYSRLFPGIAARLVLNRETDQDLADLQVLRSIHVAFDTEGRVNPLTTDH